MTLPTFLVIGAARCGTTSLHHYLGQHPEVFMSAVKEPRYFHRAEDAPPTREAYEALFADAGDARAVGEATPTYLREPEVPARVHDLIPDARLVAILRDPVERAYASYLGLTRDGFPTAPTFEAALETPQGRHMLDTGRYHQHLARWHALFGRERVRAVLYDDLRDDPHALLAELFAFLGVDPAFVADVGERRGGTGRVANPFVRPLWERSAGVRRLVRPVVPLRLRDAAYGRVTRDLVRPPMRPETRARLREALRPDVLALEELLERDLSAWLEEPAVR